MAHAGRESIQNPLRPSIDQPVTKVIHLRIYQISDNLVQVSIKLQYKSSRYGLVLVVQAQNFIQKLSETQIQQKLDVRAFTLSHHYEDLEGAADFIFSPSFHNEGPSKILLNCDVYPLPERILSYPHIACQLMLDDSVKEGVFIRHFQYLLESLRHVHLCLSIVKVNHVHHGGYHHSLLFTFKVTGVKNKSQISDEKRNSTQRINRCTYY